MTNIEVDDGTVGWYYVMIRMKEVNNATINAFNWGACQHHTVSVEVFEKLK